MAEKVQKVAAVIKPAREFQMNDGKTLHSHDVVFEDGEEGSCITGPDEASSKAMQEALAAVKGQEVEWELDNPREYQGVRKWKIVQFPGKPKGQGGGGGGRGREWVDQTPSMEAQGAVKNAIHAIGPYDTGGYENVPEYLGLVREMAKGLYKVVQDIKGTTEPPKKTAMQEDAVRIFGSEGAVQIAYKKAHKKGTSFKDITDEELEALIEQKAAEEATE